MDAFRRLAMVSRGQVRCQTFRGDPGPRTLSGSAEALLLEPARVADESRGSRHDITLDETLTLSSISSISSISSTSAISPAEPPAPAPEPPQLSFDEWFEKGIEASLQKRQRDALEAFQQAAKLNPRDSKTQANIVRLEHLLRPKEN